MRGDQLAHRRDVQADGKQLPRRQHRFCQRAVADLRRPWINVWELIRSANRHPRVNILQPGPGVGGHCIAVDPWFIVAQNPQQARLIRTAREVNDHKPEWVIEQVKAQVADCLNATNKRASELTIACFGLAFKPNIDDLRESPAMEIAAQIARWHSGTTSG